MDKLKNRIKYYLVGLGIGVLAVYFMFGNRGCSWLPANRVKNMIGEKEIIVGDSIIAVMNCLEINNDDIYRLLKSDGNVEFNQSKTSGVPKIYYIEAEKESDLYWARFALYEEKGLAEVVEVATEKNNSCTITVSNKRKSTLPLPHADVIAILESHEFRILEDATCEMEFYNISEKALFDFHKTAEIEIENSAPRLSPNPYYYMLGELDGKTYSIKYIIGDNRTRIERIIGDEKTDCETSM